MYLKTLTAIAMFSITTVAALAQDEPNNGAPKPTLADVQHLAGVIAGDKSKIRAYCELGGIHDQLRQALDSQNTKAIDAIIAKVDALEQQLGPEYDKVIEGLELIDLSSAEGQEIAEVFKALQEKCE
jgi:ribosomal protein S5